jgi:hypothetical protein
VQISKWSAPFSTTVFCSNPTIPAIITHPHTLQSYPITTYYCPDDPHPIKAIDTSDRTRLNHVIPLFCRTRSSLCYSRLALVDHVGLEQKFKLD